MNGTADGSIRVIAKLDSSEAEKDLQKFNKSCERTKEKIEGFAKSRISGTGYIQYDPKQVEKEMEDILRKMDNTKTMSTKGITRDANLQAKAAGFAAKISSLERYEKVLNQIETSMRIIENETRKLSDESGLDYDKVIKENREYQKLEAQLKAVKDVYREVEQEADKFSKAKLESTTIKDINGAANLQAEANGFAAKISSLKQYEAALVQTEKRMRAIEEETQHLAEQNGVDYGSALRANQAYQKLEMRLRALKARSNEFKTANTSAFSQSKKSAIDFGGAMKKGIRQMGRYTLAMFGARSAITALTQTASTYIQSNDALANSVTGIKGVFAEMLGPAVEYVINIVKTAMAYVNAFVRVLTGIDFVARYNAKALKKQADATKAAANAAKAQSAAFDEQNKLQDNSADSGGTKGKTAGALELPDVDTSKVEAFAEKLRQNIELVAVAASIGALALGIVLCFTGVAIPLGLSLMVIGAAGLAATLALTWDKMSNEVKAQITKIMAIAGGAFLVLGIILCATGVALPLGIALIVAGAALLVTAVVLNWDTVKEGVKNNIDKIAAIAGGALLVLGIILCVTGVMLPLGIALIAAGAAGLVASLVLAWDKMPNETKSLITKIMAIAGVALLVLGIILCATGVGIPLGIALIAAGAVSLVTVAALNKDAIKDWVKSCWDSVKNFFNEKIKPKFTKEYWQEKLQGIKDGMKETINGVIGIVEKGINFIVGKLNKLSWDIPDWVPVVGGKSFGFHIDSVSLPRLAHGGIVNVPGRGVPLVAGEAGREAILPLENNTEWMDILAEKLGGTITIPIVLDGKRIAEYVIDLNKKRAFAANGVI